MSKKAGRSQKSLKSPGGARPGLVRVGVYLPKDLVIDLKIRAATDGTSVSSIAQVAFKAYLDDRIRP